MTKELRRRLLAIAEGETLSIQEWWMVDLVCRQGLEIVAAGKRLGVGAQEAWGLWRGLEELAPRHGESGPHAAGGA